MLARPTQHETVVALRTRLLRWESADRPAFWTGLHPILPRGLQRGTLTEYLAASGSGATAVALIAAREACREGQALVVVERRPSFYPPAAANFGINSGTIYVHPRTQKDELWALNQALRCRGVGAVLGWPEKLAPRAFRSLQLAAETGGSVGFLIRPPSVRGLPTWSQVQLFVEALPSVGENRRLRIEVVRSRSGNVGASLELELDDETGTLQKSRDVRLAAELAPAKARCHSPGA